MCYVVSKNDGSNGGDTLGTLRLYESLFPLPTVVQPVKIKEHEHVFAGKPILSDAKELTLAQYDVVSKNAITAHNLKDYRRKNFNLVLLPKVDNMFIRVLEGSVYWSELLQNDSPFS